MECKLTLSTDLSQLRPPRLEIRRSGDPLFADVYRSPTWRNIVPPGLRGILLLVAERAKAAHIVRKSASENRIILNKLGLTVASVDRPGKSTLWILFPVDSVVKPHVDLLNALSAGVLQPQMGDWTRLLGRTLGYADCCIDAFLNETSQVSERLWDCAPFARYEMQLRQQFEQIGWYPRALDYLSIGSVPCRPACPEALADCELWMQLLETLDQAAADSLRFNGLRLRQIITADAGTWEKYVEVRQTAWARKMRKRRLLPSAA